MPYNKGVLEGYVTPAFEENLSRYALVIEDDAALSEEIATTLRKNDISVIISATANDAIVKSRNQKFSCIIVDLNLEKGKGSGVDVIDFIRQDVKSLNYKTPIIVASGAIDQLVLKHLKHKVQSFFTKPFSSVALKNTFDKLTHHISENSFDHPTQYNYEDSDPKSVLYVEDEEDLALEIVEEMEDSNIGVVHVTSADAAFLQTQKREFDCIIVDINLSIGRGDELIEKIRYDTLNINRDTPIIVASSQLSKQLIGRISGKIQAGVVKPYSIKDLFSKLKPYIPYI